MQVHKTSGVPDGKTVHEQSAKNVQEKKRSSAARTSAQIHTAKTQPVQAKPAAASRSMLSAVVSAKLPADKLSASIISFARFFSLPLKPELLAAIRRHAFAPQDAAASQAEITQSELLKQGTAENADSSQLAAKNRLAFSLAVAAAESKGTELDAKGLELYADAIDPDMERRQDTGGRNRQRNKKQNEQNNEGEDYKSGSVNSSTIKKIALESAESNPLLYLLNRLPGRDGRRWIVLPFDIDENGRDYRVSLRILPETPNRTSFMALDIAETSNLEKRSTFTLEAANGIITTLNIYIQPEPSPKAKQQLERALSGVLNILVERVSVRKSGDTILPEFSGGDELFRSVDEAV